MCEMKLEPKLLNLIIELIGAALHEQAGFGVSAVIPATKNRLLFEGGLRVPFL